MDRLEVQTSRMQPVLMGVMGAIFIPLGVASIYVGVSDGFSAVPVALGVAMLATFVGIRWLTRRAHGRSVRWFTREGLERNDGQRYAWSDLERVVHQVRNDPARPGKKALWRIEIWFTGGRCAWLVPLRVGNPREVSELVAGLPCEHQDVEV